MIKSQTYSINKLLLTNEVLESYISNFWSDIFTPLNSTKHLMLMCKVEFTESEMGYRTLGDLRRVNFTDKKLFLEYLILRLGLLTESYTTHAISKITFTYIIKDGLATAKDRTLLQDLSDKTITTHRFNNMNLPITMNPADYGTIMVDNYIQVNGESVHRFNVVSGAKSYLIDSSKDGLVNNVTIQGAVNLSWVDTSISEGIFMRSIGKSIIYFMGGERVLSKKMLSAKAITNLKVDTNLNSNFITMDIETIKGANNKLTPYLICAYNGLDFLSSYANESLDQKALFDSFINQLFTFFTKNSNTLVVYAHNFGSFDGIFLFRHLIEYGILEPIVKDGKIITLKINLTVEGYKNKTIVFKDSYLMLPLGLRRLCEAFKVKSFKTYFPFNLTDIFYIGVFPKFELWVGITLSEFDTLAGEFMKNTWSFKEEAIKYCKLDTQSLHEILTKFNELIFSHFKINIHTHLTLPSLAMNIYRSTFMPKDKIYQLGGNVESDIRQSYTGGAVDVYIPHNRVSTFFGNVKTKFKQLFYYDVNSLYPFIMCYTPMPVGKPIAFYGNIRTTDPNAYGFFYCKITSPDNLEHPILQRRIKTCDGLRTVAGLGSWTGWIYSLEMDNAMNYGYTFEILKGYQFEKGSIFKEYVETMYNLRMKYEKGHPMNLIAKLLMNSLYGKFGMKNEGTLIEIFNTTNDAENQMLEEMLDVYGPTVKDFFKIGNHIVTIRKSLLNYTNDENEDKFHGLNVNVAIASAISAGARMWMSSVKNNPNFNIYYSDTDSVVTDAPLPSFMVGKDLGQFKLEHPIKRAVFLAPKVYGFIDVNGNEVIKIKGLANESLSDIHVSDLELLLIKDSSKTFTQNKWFKNLVEGEISVLQQAYTLKVTSNKRAPIYINNILSNTKPFNYDEFNNN
jgi:DNA polymerase family B